MGSYFKTTVNSWLDKTYTEQRNQSVQVFETDSSDKHARVAAELAEQRGLRVFCFQFQANVVTDPYFIIHHILTDFAAEFGQDFVSAIVEENIYSAHKLIFQKWYEQKHYYRHEVMVYDEVGYEQFEFHASLSRILKALSVKKNFLLILNNVHNAPHAILDFINRILDSDVVPGEYGILAFVPGQNGIIHQAQHLKWPLCLNRLERMGLILPLEPEQITPLRDSFWDYPTQLKPFDRQLQALTAAVDLFAFEDVIQLVDIIGNDIDHEQAGRLLFLSGYAHLMNNQVDAAVQSFNKSLNCLQASPSQNIMMAVYFWLSICFAIKGRERYARANQEQMEKLAIEYDNQRFYVLSLFSSFYINSRVSQYLLTVADLVTLKFLLTSLNYEKLLSIVLLQVFSPENQDFASPRTLLQNCMLSMRIARRHKNIYGISIALQAMGVCYSRLGNNSQTNRLFMLSLKLCEKFQRQTNFVYMLNSLGYHYVGLEKWTESWHYFDSALDHLIESKNYTELTVTLFNYSWLYGQSGNFLWAIDILNDLLELMFIRGAETLPYRNLKDIYAYKGWLHIQAKQPIQAQYCLMRFQKLTHLYSTAFSSVLEQLLISSLESLNSNSSQAANSLNKASQVLERTEDFDLYMLSVLELETARLYKKMGYEQEANKLFDSLRERAQRLNFNALAQRTSRASLGLALTELSPLPAIKRPYRLLMTLAQKESQVIEFQHQLSDLHQANLLVELSTAEATIEGFLMRVIEVLDRRIPANHLMISLYESHSGINTIEVSNNAPREILDSCKDYLSDKSYFKSQLSFDLDANIVMAWPLNMKASDRAWLIICGDEDQSLVWNKEYLQLVAQQLGLVLDRRLREVQLEHQTRTDMLTGVLNRPGLFERMNKHFSYMQRHPNEGLTLCYFDLDHFKYVNDRFGHELGDKVLRSLTHLVNENLRESDEFGRIGGDEFIILLPSTDQPRAVQILERIRIAIEKPDWWLALFDIQQESDSPIDKENWITASFGAVVVHSWPDGGLNRIDIMAQADELMYHAKKAGRNQICIKDFIDTTE